MNKVALCKNPWYNGIKNCRGARYDFFGEAPEGAAIYSIIFPEAEAQITLKNNQYTHTASLLFHFGGISDSTLAAFQERTGKDLGSTYKS